MLTAGSSLGAYRIVRLLGQGGMGTVYEAEHVALRVRRALKVFETESEHGELLRKRFVAEGRILADLDHPRIVRVCDFAVDPATGAPYFAMDLVVSPTGEPETLEKACGAGADEDRIADWFRDICEGLAYIHAKGVVHRDISLDNILIGSDGRAVLTDFGIAKIVGDDYRRHIDITRTMPLRDGSRMSWGKGLYMAPELVRGQEATPASDAYALGVILFRILAGSWYTPAVRLEDALAGLGGYNWSEVIARLCANDPGIRLDADGMSGAAALLRKADAARPESGRRRARAMALGVLGALAVSLVLALALLTRRDAAPSGAAPAAPQTVIHIVDVTNVVPQTVIHVVDVTNRVRETVYEIVPVTNRVATPGQTGDARF